MLTPYTGVIWKYYSVLRTEYYSDNWGWNAVRKSKDQWNAPFEAVRNISTWSGSAVSPVLFFSFLGRDFVREDKQEVNVID